MANNTVWIDVAGDAP